jgi:hypothetical protein
MALHTFSTGEIAGVSTNLNNNFEYCAEEIYARDLTTGDKSITIPANTFSRYFKIIFGYELYGSCGSANGSNGYISLSVGGTTILSRITRVTDLGSPTTQDSVSGSDSIIFRASDIDLTGSILVTIETASITIKGTGGTSSQVCNYISIEGV